MVWSLHAHRTRWERERRCHYLRGYGKNYTNTVHTICHWYALFMTIFLLLMPHIIDRFSMLKDKWHCKRVMWDSPQLSVMCWAAWQPNGLTLISSGRPSLLHSTSPGPLLHSYLLPLPLCMNIITLLTPSLNQVGPSTSPLPHSLLSLLALVPLLLSLIHYSACLCSHLSLSSIETFSSSLLYYTLLLFHMVPQLALKSFPAPMYCTIPLPSVHFQPTCPPQRNQRV